MKLYERLDELEELTSNSFDEFLEQLKQEEISFYDSIVQKYYNFSKNEDLYRAKDSSHEEFMKWNDYLNKLWQISRDYDVSSYVDTIKRYGEERYKRSLESRIDEHITKLHKQIKKQIGKVVSISKTGNNTYYLEGNNGTCIMTMSPIKVSNSGMIVKPRIKISDVTQRETPLDYVPEKEDNEYIKQWKENELNAQIERFNNFLKRYTELNNEHSEDLDKVNHYYNYGIKYDSEEYHEIHKKSRESYDRLKQMQSYYQYSFSVYEKTNRGTDTDKVKEIFKKDINEHFKALQAKVEHKIGEIVKIFPLSSNGADYHFEGTIGDCDIEVILAGGYNIQRLHTRWIIRNVKMK